MLGVAAGIIHLLVYLLVLDQNPDAALHSRMLSAKGYPHLFYGGGWWTACLMTIPCRSQAAAAEAAGGGWFRLGGGRFRSAVVDFGRRGAV